MAMGVKPDVAAGDADGCFVRGVYYVGGSQMRDSKRLAAIRQLPCCECGIYAISQ